MWRPREGERVVSYTCMIALLKNEDGGGGGRAGRIAQDAGNEVNGSVGRIF